MAERFIIAFVGRSGSSYLQGLLDSHPHATCAGEIIRVDAGFDWRAELDALDERQCASGALQSGFKLGHTHMRAHPGIRKDLLRRGYVALFLKRSNKVDQYISLMLAKLNNSWRSDFGSFSIERFEANPKEMSDQMNKFVYSDALVEEFVEDFKVLNLSYEQLNDRSTLSSCLKFLGLEDKDLTSVFTRQRSESSQRAALANYDALKVAFSDTRWASHFLE